MTKNQFSNDKIFFFSDKISKIMAGHVVNPVVYELSLCGKCNCHCKYCCCQNFHNNRMLNRQEIHQIVLEISENDGRAVTITGGGEPLLNPEFIYCVEALASQNISIGVITNGLLLNEKISDAIARHASFCRISLDTVDKKLYSLLRGTSLNICALKKALKQLTEKKKSYHSNLLIGAQIVYIDQSDEDIEQTILFCRECNLDFLQIRPLDNITGEQLIPKYEFYRSKRQFLNKVCNSFTTKSFSVIINENKFKEYDTNSVSKNYQSCIGGNFTASIGHDMQVYFCCANIGNPELCIGNLKTDSLKNILSSQYRRELISHPKWKFCQQQCRNHNMNKILQGLLSLPQEQVKNIIKEKVTEPRPLHCDFL